MKKLGSVLVVALALGAVFYFVQADRYAGFDEPVFVEIPRGTSTLRIGELLADAGVVKHPFLFVAARAMRWTAKPQAGEYRFERAATAGEVCGRIAKGDVYLVELVVPEGSDVFDIAALVERAGFARASEFVEAGLKQEGYLFPDTYRFRRKTGAAAICRVMRARFDAVWKELGGGREAERETVIMASLVETEAVLDSERGRIAGVYGNRLKKKMRLECDPTVEYASKLRGRWSGVIRRSDLDSDHPYNTYKHAGLPPGPVGNAGRKSLAAALRPEKTEALYFVAAAGGTGGHVFSVDYAGHQRAVASYRNEGKSHRVAAKPKG